MQTLDWKVAFRTFQVNEGKRLVPAGTFHFVKGIHMPSLTDKAVLCYERGRVHYEILWFSAKVQAVSLDGEIVLSDEFFRIPELGNYHCILGSSWSYSVSCL